MNIKTVIWLIASVVVPILLLLILRTVFGVSEGEIALWLSGLRDSPLVVPTVIGLFCALAFIGAPQWALVGGAVLALGPIFGGVLSWVASLVSACLGFWIGHVAGAKRLEKIDAALIRKLSGAVQRNGFMTSLVVRLVPTGPAILVNLAAGVSKMRFLHFLAGTAIGIIPKILVIALIGAGVISGLSGSLMAVGFAALAAFAVLGSWWASQRLARRTNVSGE